MTDDRSLQELFHKYYKSIYRLASNRLYTYTGSTTEAQDVVQEVFFLAAQKDIHHHPNPGGWLAVATNNLCMNYSKAAQSRREKLENAAKNASVHSKPSFLRFTDASDDITENVDTMLTLESILSPEDFRIVVERYIHRRSLADIANEMGLSHVAIRVRIHRICLRLKKIFSAM